MFELISTKFHSNEVTEESIRNIKINISRICQHLDKKWLACGRTTIRFETTSAGIDWLNGEDLRFAVTYYLQPSTSQLENKPAPGPGRPKIEFDQASLKTKRRRVDDLIQSRSTDELAVAAQISNRLAGNRDVADVIKCVTEIPHKASDIKKKISTPITQRCLSSDEALAYYVDAKCSRHTYQQTRKWALKAGHNVYPSYHNVMKAKNNCYIP